MVHYVFSTFRPKSPQAALLLIFVVIVLSWSSCAPPETVDRQPLTRAGENPALPNDAQQPLSAGDPVELNTAQVETTGGQVVVRKSGDPLDGLTIEVPAGSYSRSVPFTISSSTIEEHRLGPDVRVLTPLISVDNGGGYAQKPITVTIPIEISDSEFAMAFRYEKDTGALEGLTSAALQQKSLTVVTAHFSDLFVVARDKTRLDGLNWDTRFAEGRDDWSFPNEGSILEPGGVCQGMCLSEMWYFTHEKPIVGENLWDQNTNGLGPGRETPHFWPDDTWAIKLASMVQVSVGTRFQQFSDAVLRAFQRESRAAASRLGREEYQLPFNRIQFYSIALAMEITRHPQLVAVHDDSRQAHHAVVCYRIDGYRLYFEDPNHPGPNPGRNYVDYDDGGMFGDGTFTPYETALTSRDWHEGRRIRFPTIVYGQRTSLLGDQALQRYWLDFKSDNIGRVAHLPNAEKLGLVETRDSDRVFPEYTLRITERDDRGARGDEFELDRSVGATVRNKNINVAVRSSRPLSLYVYRFEDVQEWEKGYSPGRRDLPKRISNGRVTLQPGPNLLGFHTEGMDNAGWAGFDWVTVVYEPTTSTPTSVRPVATPTPRVRPTPVASQTSAVPGLSILNADDCGCGRTGWGLASSSANYGGSGTPTGSLQCTFNPGDGTTTRSIMGAIYSPDPSFAARAFENNKKSLSLSGAENIIESTDTRFTKLSQGRIGNQPSWTGIRFVLYKGYYQLSFNVSGVHFPTREAALQEMDRLEECLKARVDR